ncbi:cytochrome c oxidase assembly protein [Virgibacillus salexigens]|uniref:Cytochrome c oxidase assembly factor CtaG n=1 Tax=Virgibacillus massiliensis TaxID=1462526 RepID=A0A024Q7P3_9BACI|nr:cytochrome c oxidase assembly protein [Virgibacillus massiliensis]BCT36553.1 cytochrome c oxidase assembly protein [Virgibacillus massiliensis]CDQ37941.1 cytochrome c oxidase assembly factor CtaG [Virgibacillus massiliensis]
MTNYGMHGSGMRLEWFLIVMLILAIGIYTGLGIFSKQKTHLKPWPLFRYVCWWFGIIAMGAALIGPVAGKAHTDFTVHMIGHLFLGMLAPLLIALAAPITLILRALPVHAARRLSMLLKNRLIRLFRHPITASLLNIGGLWLLYTTGLYELMQQHMLVHVLVHFHVFAAGYLFTISMIYIDPAPHRFSHMYRAIVLVCALSGHAILSKYIYANPPVGVPKDQAETGAMLMYYGGDVMDGILIFILCLHWYHAARPKQRMAISTS